MKNNKLLIVSGVVVAVGLYMVWKKLTSNTNDSVPEVASPPIIDLENVSIPDKDLVLSLGSNGIEVKALQTALKNLKTDGIFGALTLARLKAITGKIKISLNQYNDFIDKDVDVKYIVGSKKSNNSLPLYGLEKEFLKAWSDGIKSGLAIFPYNEKIYNTQGGTVSK